MGGPALRRRAVGQDPHGGALARRDAVGVELDRDGGDRRSGGRRGRRGGRRGCGGGGGRLARACRAAGRRGALRRCLRLRRAAHEADHEDGPRISDSPDPEHRRTPLRRSFPSIHRFRGYRPPDTQIFWANPYQ
ncbi:hypothetical protein FR742_42520 [Nonomuraea sp. C10]|nr:hypothetical protein FR742_42520 [Nonomuraea sp. C10]